MKNNLKDKTKYKLKGNSGVTLIVLVIMIIIMLILINVSIGTWYKEDSPVYELEEHQNALNELYNVISENNDEYIEEVNSDYNNVERDNSATPSEAKNIAIANDSWNGSVNAPCLHEGMTAIYWDNEGQEVQLTSSSSSAEWAKWYDYYNKKWANAKTADGSYWVWIPRFAYKITSNLGKSETGNISIVFIDVKNRNGDKKYSTVYPDVQDNAMTDYVVHPAFGVNFDNGGSDKNISGFWVAKYEMSKEVSNDSGANWSWSEGDDVLTKNAGNTNYVRCVSKPNVSSWGNLKADNYYLNSFNYNRDMDSHLMKNSEWGAVVYLAHSAYGLDGEDITQNDDTSTYLTGTGGESASTTRNITGVYDMSGGRFDVVAGYILNLNGNDSRTQYASSFALSERSTKYVTVYPHNSENDSKEANDLVARENLKNIFGDATVETCLSSGNYQGWDGDTIIYPYNHLCIFVRGGIATYTETASGIFMYGRTTGQPSDGYGYRVTLF